METQIQLKSVVLFIAVGAMVFIIVFIFAKRQITRFTLKSSRAPHATIGADVPKALRQELERRLRRTQEISHQPHLLSPEVQRSVDTMFNKEPCHFLYRMKAVDALPQLDEAVRRYSECKKRSSSHSLRAYLVDLRQTGPLTGVKLNLIDKFVDAYDHARHDPAVFNEEHYKEYTSHLNQLIHHIEIRADDRKLPHPKLSTTDTNQSEPQIDTILSANKNVDKTSPTNSRETKNSNRNAGSKDNSEVTYRPRLRREGSIVSPSLVELLPLTDNAQELTSSRESSASEESTVIEGLKLSRASKGESVI